MASYTKKYGSSALIWLMHIESYVDVDMHPKLLYDIV